MTNLFTAAHAEIDRAIEISEDVARIGKSYDLEIAFFKELIEAVENSNQAAEDAIVKAHRALGCPQPRSTHSIA